MSLFTVCNADGPRIRHGSHGRTYKRNTQRAAGRRAVLDGFPVPARHMSDDEIRSYLSAPLITCLLCGKAYRKLGGPHLEKIHGVSVDEYRARYGLPYGGGLVCAASRDAYASAAVTAGHDGNWMRHIRGLAGKQRFHRKSPPAIRAARRNIVKAQDTPREKEISVDDTRLAIRLMEERNVLFTEALEIVGISKTIGYEHVRIYGLRSELDRAYDRLPFATQARGELLGARFTDAVRALRPMSDKRIAAQLGVTAMTVNRARRKHGIL